MARCPCHAARATLPVPRHSLLPIRHTSLQALVLPSKLCSVDERIAVDSRRRRRTDWQIVAKLSMLHGFWPPGSSKPKEDPLIESNTLKLAAAVAIGAAAATALLSLRK